MRFRILILVALTMIGLSAAGQGEPAKKTEPKNAPESKKNAPSEKRITDKDGKTYILRETPFGIAKVEDKPEDNKVAEPSADFRAFEDGDSVRFEKPTPFGVARWVRKMSELDDEERAVWERDRRAQASKAPAKPKGEK